jgi:coenzyme F420-reducing hydrogenase delta subunit
MEHKLSELVDENAKLKTKLNFSDSRFESLNEQNKSFLEQIQLYEDREKHQIARKQLSACEWEQMTEEIERLKEENRKLTN